MNIPPPKLSTALPSGANFTTMSRLAVETLVAEFFRRRIAAQHGPDVPAVDIDVDVADRADLPAAR